MSRVCLQLNIKSSIIELRIYAVLYTQTIFGEKIIGFTN